MVVCSDHRGMKYGSRASHAGIFVPIVGLSAPQAIIDPSSEVAAFHFMHSHASKNVPKIITEMWEGEGCGCIWLGIGFNTSPVSN